MANIAEIRKLILKLVAKGELMIESKEDKDLPTDEDDEKISALQDFVSSIEDAMDTLDDVYKEYEKGGNTEEDDDVLNEF